MRAEGGVQEHLGVRGHLHRRSRIADRACRSPREVPRGGQRLRRSNGCEAPKFTLEKAATITEIDDYHYIDGGGPTPGTIGLKAADGKMYGPWPCVGLDGQGNVKNATWKATPNAEVPAGTYTVIDSGPGTWSTNDRAKSLGFATVLGVYAIAH